MIYIILYSILTPGTPTGTTGSLYYAWASDLGNAEKKYNELVLTKTMYQKEIWSDNGKGYRQLLRYDRYYDNGILYHKYEEEAS